MKKLGSLRKDQDGVTVIEFAMVSIPFFLLLIGITEIGLSFFANQVLENATLDTARLIRTGQAQVQGFDATKFKQEILNKAGGFPLKPDRLTIDVEKLPNFAAFTPKPLIDADGNLKDDFSYDHGEAGDIIIVRIMYRWPMITSFMKLDYADLASHDKLLVSTVIFRNEPFPWKSSGN